jgi:hypothetical protein
MTYGYHDERQKADQLNGIERKSNGHKRVGLHVGYVNQGLTDAGDQHGRAQAVHREPIGANH